jgi:hypothetical protein
VRCAAGNFNDAKSPSLCKVGRCYQNMAIEDQNAVLIQKQYSVDVLGRKVREVLDSTF